jgi:spore germination protein KB
MMERGQISSAQLAIIMIPVVLATSILSVPSATMALAGQMMWATPLLAALPGLLCVWLAFGLQKLYPGTTLMGACTSALGKWGGKLAGLAALFYTVQLTGVIIRLYGEFVAESALPETPLLAIMGTMVAVCIINVRSGIEVVGRSAQFLVALFVLLASFLFLLLIGDLNPQNMLPLWEGRLTPALKGSIAPSGWLAEYVYIAFLLPLVSDQQRLHRRMLHSLLFVVAAMIVTNIVCLMLMGDLTASFQYPVMIAARYISIADFMQHLEAIVIAIWISGVFVKISFFLYIVSQSTAEWLGLDSFRPIVLPMSLLCLVFAVWSGSSQLEFARIYGTVGNIYTLTMLLALPALLYLIGLLKQRLTKPKSKDAAP